MDYSASINEAEDPVGASPWGNSPTASPRQPRPGLGALGEEGPPFRFSSQTSNGFSQDPLQPEGFQRPGTATTASGTDGETEGSTTLSANDDEQQEASSIEPQSAAASQPSQPEPAPVESAYEPRHAPQPQQEPAGQAQEPRKQPTKPQLRLQAKITGLERTGKKDPILRFDVHVSNPAK